MSEKQKQPEACVVIYHVCKVIIEQRDLGVVGPLTMTITNLLLGLL